MSWCHIYYITSVILYIYSGYVTASEYYVSAAPNGESCPHTHLLCHNLSYYTDNYSSYFTDDAIFYFLEGTHILQDTLEISGVSNITLQGLGHIEQGFHETVMQSTSIIRLNGHNSSNIQFTFSTDVVLKSLTIANYGFNLNSSDIDSLVFGDTNNVTLEWLSVQNGSGNGLILDNAFDVLITNSTFANNRNPYIYVANVVIYYSEQAKRLSRINIVKSNFTLALGSGMTLVYHVDNEINVEVIIEKSCFSNNNGQTVGGILINFNNGSGSIKFTNCTIYNNIATNWGGGVSIFLENGNGIIEFSNCIIYNNTAPYGGGVYISFQNGNGSIEFSNTTVYNNIAQYGGGVYSYLYNGSGNIEFSTCNIYNNTAYYGSGLFIIALQSTSKFRIFLQMLHFVSIKYQRSLININLVCQL